MRIATVLAGSMERMSGPCRDRGGELAEEQNSSERKGEEREGECRDEAAAWAQGSRVVAKEIR